MSESIPVPASALLQIQDAIAKHLGLIVESSTETPPASSKPLPLPVRSLLAMSRVGSMGRLETHGEPDLDRFIDGVLNQRQPGPIPEMVIWSGHAVAAVVYLDQANQLAVWKPDRSA